MRLLSACFAVLLCCTASLAQQQLSTTTTVVRDPLAVTLVQQALLGMGGPALSTVFNAQVQGTLEPTEGSYVPTGNFTWLDDFSGGTFEFRHEIDTPTAQRIQVSGHGSPAVEQDTKVVAMRPNATATALPYHLPGVLLAHELADANYSIQMGDTTTVSGKPAVQVILKNPTGPVERSLSEQHWYFDPTTLMPIRIEYRLASVLFASDSIDGAVELSNYQVVNGIAIPFQIDVFENGKPTSIAKVSSVALNIADSSSDFDLPVGGAQ